MKISSDPTERFKAVLTAEKTALVETLPITLHLLCMVNCTTAGCTLVSSSPVWHRVYFLERDGEMMKEPVSYLRLTCLWSLSTTSSQFTAARTKRGLLWRPSKPPSVIFIIMSTSVRCNSWRFHSCGSKTFVIFEVCMLVSAGFMTTEDMVTQKTPHSRPQLPLMMKIKTGLCKQAQPNSRSTNTQRNVCSVMATNS